MLICLAIGISQAGQGRAGQGRAGQGRAGQGEAGHLGKSPVRLHFDVLSQHVEAHGLAGLNVILQSRICRGSVDAVRPVALHSVTIAVWAPSNSAATASAGYTSANSASLMSLTTS